MEYKITTKNEMETIELAQNFESEKFPNMIICLNGELGSGKTMFTRKPMTVPNTMQGFAILSRSFLFWGIEKAELLFEAPQKLS